MAIYSQWRSEFCDPTNPERAAHVASHMIVCTQMYSYYCVKFILKCLLLYKNVFLLFQANFIIYNPIYYLNLLLKLGKYSCNYTQYISGYNAHFKIVFHTCCSFEFVRAFLLPVAVVE